jgi:small subunit ribosomal protein S20
MPIIKSAKKRVKLAAKAKTRNNRTRRDLRGALKAFEAAFESGKSDAIGKAQRAAISALDMAAKKNVIHANKAGRQKARLSAKAKSQGVKLTKSVASTAGNKSKSAAKIAPVKKPAASAAKNKK